MAADRLTHPDHRPDDGAGGQWSPSVWLRSLAQLPPAPWPVGRSVRAAVAVGGPVLVAALAGDAAVGLWISIGTVLMAAGERSVDYASRFRQLAATASLAGPAYLLGYLSEVPEPALVAAMAAVAFLSGVLSGYSGVLSVATMQAMLVAAIAIGTEAAQPYGRSALLFIAAAALYAALLAVEVLVDRRRPQRDALVSLLRALAQLARRQAGGEDLAADRLRATREIDAFDPIAMAHRGVVGGPTARYARAARISRAADQFLARLLAHDAVPGLSAAAAARLDECADAVARRRRPPPNPAPEGTLVRLRMLESAIWDDVDTLQDLSVPERARLALPGPQLLASAGRLSLCTALAYVAYCLLPVAHGYWIALTVALVMKPDLGSVFSRAVLRLAGSAGGVLLVIVVAPILDEAILASLVSAALAAALPWAMARSYALQAMFLTPLIIVLLNVAAPETSVIDLAGARIAATAIGGAIVVVAGYLIWPSARHPRVAVAFAAALDGLARYAKDTAAGAAQDVIAGDRRAVYRRLSDTRVSLQRTLSEPPPAGAEAYAWIPVVAAAERVADHVTGASASRIPPASAPSARALSALADELAEIAASEARADPDTRPSIAPARGGDDPDPAVRELADELAALRPMLTRR